MTNDLRWMISSDQQFPYHDKRAVELWFKVMKWYKPDVVDYLGDQSDQACYSKYSDGTTEEFFNSIAKRPEESPVPFVLETERITKEFYEQTRALRPNADVFVALGNHDIRVFSYMDKKAPQWLAEITPNALWGLDDLGIDYIYYSDLPRLRYGDIYVHHGISALKDSVSSVKSDIDNLGVSLMRGHSHRLGSYYQTYELRNEVLRGFEIGHMSDVKCAGMMYTNVHNWQLGFATATIVNDQPHIQLIEIRQDDTGYTCVVDGKKFGN